MLTKKILVRLCAFLNILFIVFSPVALSAQYSSLTAFDYLKNVNNNPWVVMALSVENTMSQDLTFLKNIFGDSAINFEAPILALSSMGKDPKIFGNIDYVAKLKTFADINQLGDPTTVNDDIFGILALRSSGLDSSDEVIQKSKNYILEKQNVDGGWGWSVTSTSDSNTTASAIMALVSCGLSPADPVLQKSKNYLLSSQNIDGGFTYDPQSSYGTNSDVSSTAWSSMAFIALGINPTSVTKAGKNPYDFLNQSQNILGYFDTTETSFTPTQTAYAVLALSGKTLPLSPASTQTNLENFSFRIEGATEKVCEGQTQGPSALDIVKNASLQCGFTYNISPTAYGPYLDKINTDSASGSTGWQYAVNNTPPSVGASDYVLKTGDTVLWYFGHFDVQITRLQINQTQITSGQSTIATIEYTQNGSNWLPLLGATVYLGAQSFTTNSQGQVILSGSDGYYKIYGEKTGFTRSNSISLTLGNPSQNQVSLSANIENSSGSSGQIQGSTIAFNINANSLDFGNLKPGNSSTKSLVLSNTGNVTLSIQSSINGDVVFKDNILLNNQPWQKYTQNFAPSENQTLAVKLSLPKTYSVSSGSKNGQLIFWVTAK